MKKKIVIVGGVAAGASCAARLRRLDEELEIIVFEKSSYVSYANCGLPYYLSKTIEKKESLLVQTPKSLRKRFNIDARVNSEVVKIDSTNKKVYVKHNDEMFEETYDYLVLAPGCRARKLFENEKGLYHLRNVEDVIKIEEKIENASNIAIIGGGFVGIEVAENLSKVGKSVTVFEYGKHILPNIDEDLVVLAENTLKNNNIKLLNSSRIVQVETIGEQTQVILGNESSYVFDLVISAAGVQPNTEFIKESGIKLDYKGYIEVDEYLQTNIKDVYAAGDAISVISKVTGKKVLIPLAGPANRQGRMIADNIIGMNKKYKGSLGTSIIKIFDLSVASVGMNSNQLRKEKIQFQTICLHPQNHANYYPGAKPIHTKMFYDIKTEKILGVQAIGKEGIDKLIDVMATVMNFGGTINDLTDLELCYAPPYLSAKSPANYFGFVAENIQCGLEEMVTVEESLKKNKDHILLDVRTSAEHERGNFKTGLHIPVDELRSRIEELEEYKDMVLDVYCAVGIRGHIACRILKQNGFKTRNVTGGFTTYKNWKGE